MRADLAALTPEALAALTNLGLVKRAQREIAQGQGPQLHEDADGTVTGTFPDGTVAKLPRSVTLDDAPCTCGAPRACRHRIAVALAYATAAPTEPADDASPLLGELAWSPGEIDDGALETALGRRLLDTARATRDRGLLVTVNLAGRPAAHLPTCTVRFLVPRDVALAKCDCADVGGRCEHLALAVWAFRALAAGATGGIVQLGAAAAQAPVDGALDEVLELGHALLDTGVALAPNHATRFARVRAALDRGGLTWLHALVSELEIALEGYAARSARYGTREIAALLTELGARVRAGRRDGPELPARFVLGADQARETLLDHLRLTSLGARVTSDERARFADVYLADADTATVLVLRKRWDFPDGPPEEGPELARRNVAPRISLGALASGALVSKAVKRGASRAISLSTGAGGRTSLTLQVGDFSGLPEPLLVRDLAAHAAAIAHRPPRLLRPRVLAEDVRVVEVSRVHRVVHDEAEQTLRAVLVDAAGQAFALALTHRRCAPHAIAAAAAALAGPVRYVTGDLRHGPGGWTLDPLALTTDRLVVPDLSGPVAGSPPPSGVRPALEDAVDRALDRADSALQELCHAGVRSAPAAVIARLRAAGSALADAGLEQLAGRLRAAADRPAAGRWLDAAIRLALIREAAGLAFRTPAS